MIEELQKLTLSIDGKPYYPLRINWVMFFLKWHSYLQIVITCNIELQWLTEMRKDVIIDFYIQLDQIIKENNIYLENIWNFDEIDIMTLIYYWYKDFIKEITVLKRLSLIEMWSEKRLLIL